jgi:pyrimidine operon attenuation protein/uracil phosphoribosyltransferase
MESPTETIVLNHQQIALIIERMAHELYENLHHRPEIILIGIEGRGYTVASRIFNHLKKISAQRLSLEKITLDKLDPSANPVVLSCELETLNKKTVILIDDVLNSGMTLVHALRHLLGTAVHSVTTVVLVDRIHRRFPVRADIVGMTLSTTLQERVEVSLGKQDYAYLI